MDFVYFLASVSRLHYCLGLLFLACADAFTLPGFVYLEQKLYFGVLQYHGTTCFISLKHFDNLFSSPYCQIGYCSDQPQCTPYCWYLCFKALPPDTNKLL